MHQVSMSLCCIVPCHLFLAIPGYIHVAVPSLFLYPVDKHRSGRYDKSIGQYPLQELFHLPCKQFRKYAFSARCRCNPVMLIANRVLRKEFYFHKLLCNPHIVRRLFVIEKCFGFAHSSRFLNNHPGLSGVR